MLAIDLTHSTHSAAQTGIQQVSRGLYHALSQTTREAIVYDKYECIWRSLDRREHEHLLQVDKMDAVRKKRPHWSTWQRIRGRTKHTLCSPKVLVQKYDHILIPEFFSESVGLAIPSLRGLTKGKIAALFHDCIAYDHPEWCVPTTTLRYPQYMRDLAQCDLIIAISKDSQSQLEAAWSHLGIQRPPPVVTVPLGLRIDHLSKTTTNDIPKPSVPTFLFVGTLEPRKNHKALLEAVEKLWMDGYAFNLNLVGMFNRGFDHSVKNKIQQLQDQGHPLYWSGSVSSEQLSQWYQEAEATIFPSLYEGFGLPVLESIYYDKPCLTTTCGGLAEVTPGGGCLEMLPEAQSIEDALKNYLEDASLRKKLKTEACNRSVRTMHDYAADIQALLAE